MPTTTCVALQAADNRFTASFQQVTCALLHLVTMPAFVNTVLSHLYNPIMTVIEENLDLHKVCQCVAILSKQHVAPWHLVSK